ncbi:MAG: hypothetical protein LBQ10_05025, partial [Desulfovibrio sp.]|nr:hypothetical protein [Desulfovibrio sp.]
MRFALLCFFCALTWPVHGPVLAAGPAVADDQGWTIMPAGARPAYMGIHGGTMPVSLLVVADGSSLLGFVGRTGNDFLDVLRSTKLPLFFSLPFNENANGESAEKSGGIAEHHGSVPGVFDKIPPGGVSSVFVTGNGLT